MSYSKSSGNDKLTLFYRSGLSLRDEYILSYADYLHSDRTLWRITLDYMYSCAEIGKRRADELLLRVPLRLQEQTTKQIETSIKSGEVAGVLKEVSEICQQYQRESVRRTILRVSTGHLDLSQFTLTSSRMLDRRTNSCERERLRTCSFLLYLSRGLVWPWASHQPSFG